MKKKIGLAAAAVLFLTLVLSGCSRFNAIPQASDDEILLKIQLDTKEDIGLLIVNYEANGSSGSGGTSNADKSMLRHDELIYYSLSKQEFDDPADAGHLSIQFVIITEYFDPNYENDYPAEYTKPIDAITLEANFGESYFITISGDQTNGYTAVLGG